MTYTVDLDAIMARADAATAGPWTTATTGVAGGDHWYVCDEGEAIASISTQDGINEDQREPDAEFIAHAREDIPSLVSLIRELQAGIPVRVVLDGDPDDIQSALALLLGRPVVTCDAPGEPAVWIKTGINTWHGSGQVQSRDCRYLARYCAPLTVLPQPEQNGV